MSGGRCRSCRRVLLADEDSECIPMCAPGWRREALRVSPPEQKEATE